MTDTQRERRWTISKDTQRTGGVVIIGPDTRDAGGPGPIEVVPAADYEQLMQDMVIEREMYGDPEKLADGNERLREALRLVAHETDPLAARRIAREALAAQPTTGEAASNE